jgi:hypothetical protein
MMLLVKNSIVRQNKRKQKKQQKKPKHFDVRGPWDHYCSPSTIVDKNLLDSFIIDLRTTVLE